MRTHLHEPELNVALMAQHFALSESSLLRKLKSMLGLTPQKYLQEVRLDQARLLLDRRAHDSVKAVAHAVGYLDPRSFSRRFKRRFGKRPSDYFRPDAPI